MSDTASVASFSIDNVSGGMQVEEVGQISLPDILPRRVVMLNYTLAILTDDGKLVLADLRSKGGEDWCLTGKSLTAFSKEDKKIIDLALLPGPQGTVVVFLYEKKNKERCLSAHNIKRGGKTLELGEEFSSYDKANVLGKGISNIAGDLAHAGGEPSVFSVSNLIRKLRLEDGGTALKPTPARVQVPAEYQDGILTFCVQPILQSGSTGSSRPSTATKPSQHQQSHIVVASKTKSASAKSKFAIDWYLAGKKDELANCKATIKLSEDCEPSALLVDPKDSKAVYALCLNRSAKSTALYKICKGRKSEEPIVVFNYEINAAATGMSGDPLSSSSVPATLLLAVDESHDTPILHIYTLQKTEGFRGRHPVCAHCNPLELISSPSHIISCATMRWQLSPNQVDLVLNHQPRVQLALATLVDASTGRIVSEPDQASLYRIRVVGCETQGIHPESIVLEDLERIFEDSGDDGSRLSSSVLKLCLGHSPCRDCHSQMSAMLMAGRLAAIELHYVNVSENQSNGYSGSDRFIIKTITPEKFRSIVTDLDWTQIPAQRQGTFTLSETPTSQTPTMPSCHSTPVARGTSPRTSRIPTPKMSGSVMSTSSTNRSFVSYNEETEEDDVDAAGSGGAVSMASTTMSMEEFEHQWNLMARMASTLVTMVDAESALRNNMVSLQSQLQELQQQQRHQ